MENENKVEVAQVEQIKNETPDTPNQTNAEGNKNEARKGGNRRFNNSRGGKRFNHRRNEPKEFEERVVYINRVTKVVKGGKRMKFTALVVIGNGKGKYGFGLGKSGEVPDAIKKAVEKAKKNLFFVHFVGASSIAHEVVGKFGGTQVFLKPAPEGTGVISGGSVRAILELTGVKNVYSKVYGSRTAINVIRATNDALNQLKNYKDVQALRGLAIEGGDTNVK